MIWNGLFELGKLPSKIVRFLADRFRSMLFSNMLYPVLDNRKRRTSLRNALSDSNLLGRALAGESWAAWRALLLASMGEKLRPAELEHYKEFEE